MSEIARHRFEAAAGGGGAEAAAALVAAGDAALAALAYETAAATSPARSRSTRRRRARLLLAPGDALMRAGETRARARGLPEAAILARAAGETTRWRGRRWAAPGWAS